jgi:hypothetical protein
MDQIFTTQFWHDQWTVITSAPWLVIPLLLVAGFVGWKWKAASDDGEIRELKARDLFIKDQLKSLGTGKAELEEELKNLKAQLASNAPKEDILAVAAKMDAALTKLSKANDALEGGPSSSDLELLVSKISSFAGTQFNVAGGGKTDRALEYFHWVIEPALSKAGWVHIGWDVLDEETFQMPYSASKHSYGVVTGATGVVVRADMYSDKSAAADALVNALKEIGIPATKEYAQAKHTNRNAVHILVGIML